MRVVAKRIADLANEIDLGDGHTLVVDEPPDRGGADTGPRPTQLLAASLAGCTAITIELYAGRKGWDAAGLEVSVDVGYEREVPTRFEVAVTLPPGLDDEQRGRLLAIAAKCPVHRVIAGGAHVDVVERVVAA